jgi:Argonaute siRNA chaperone (ARC) complex subunit Arb1
MRDVFLTYLSYGGVATGPNMFQGGNKKADLEGMDKDELAETMAQTSLTDDKDNIGKDTSVWAVDFEGVMKGFLSRRAPYYYGFETREQVDTITKVLSNFMNYLLHHDVCPEYAADVLAARNICKTANAEIWACAEAQRWLPGDFNIACSTLFDGSYSKLYDGTMTWMPEESGLKGFVGMTGDVAREVVKFAVAGVASEEVYQAWYKMATEDTIETVEVHQEAGFEITAIDKVDEETRAFYREQSAEYRPVGKIRTKPWTNPEGPPEDLTVEEKEASQRETSNDEFSGKSTEPVYEFFIEEAVLQYLFVGMKIEATIRKLNCGVWFFDEVLRAFCSFDIYLCNELMVGWKEPRAINRATAKLGDNLDGGEQAEG